MGPHLILSTLARCLLAVIALSPLSFPLHSQSLLKETRIDSISIHFKLGSSVIEDRAVWAKRLRGIPMETSGRILIKAYTDTTGSQFFNTTLASKRLQQVALLVKSNTLKGMLPDTLNINENYRPPFKKDSVYRRVDILIYKIVPSFQLDTPVDLQINFESGTDHILSNSTASLRELKTLMQLDLTLNIQLNGYVCCEPDYELSLKRAQMVKAYLVREDINASRITCQGFDNRVPRVPETSETNRAINRRVEVVISK
jgi:outer membrane protein OmpA-like peptidoglycan-associated protein